MNALRRFDWLCKGCSNLRSKSTVRLQPVNRNHHFTKAENDTFKLLARVAAVETGQRRFNSESRDSDSILQQWKNSVVKESSSESESSSKVSVTKRPPTTFQKQSVADFPGETGTVKRRRNMSDNSWTSAPMDDKIIWVDGEMTGLDPAVDKLTEIGVVITDKDLNIIAVQDSIVIHVEDSILENMSAWCIEHHGKSGLTEAVKNSKITHESADDTLLKFVQQYTTPGECPMAGNSIGQDRGFIRLQLPKFFSHFHYRDIDVSSIKELVRRWLPEAFNAAPRKKMSHRVIDDIMDSIAELKYYRSTVFVSRDVAISKVNSVRTK